MTRILIFTPTYDDLLEDRTCDAVEALQFNGDLQWVISDENPYPGRHMHNLLYQYGRGRQLALDGGYDAIFLVEHDMIVPPDALQKLWDTPAPVVYGTYRFRHLLHALNLFEYVGVNRIGESISRKPRLLQQARKQGCIRVSGVGFGCLLIRRQVLEMIPFVYEGDAPDLPFGRDCVQRRILQIGRTDVLCGHIDREFDRILWPFEGESLESLVEIEALRNATIVDSGTVFRIETGNRYPVGSETARKYESCGFFRILGSAT